ncbi:MAG: hypothetical protein LBH06_03925 [Rikenellaceae bacterium]|jgi:hypothetical protein|nr:hypothetical protein [Rikenellaceae bacterium]
MLYRVAGKYFAVVGPDVRAILGRIGRFDRFVVEEDDARGENLDGRGEDFESCAENPEANPACDPVMTMFTGCDIAPLPAETLYGIEVEGVRSVLERYDGGHQFRMFRSSGAGTGTEFIFRKPLDDGRIVAGPIADPAMFHFGLWMAFNMALAPLRITAVHSSTIVYRQRAVLFLGESGVGKSTHTRLWLNNVEGSWLLNDDSPFIAAGPEGCFAHGSPWSGKTPCYNDVLVPIAAVVRLSQAPRNRLYRLSPVEAFGALYPSVPPAFGYDPQFTDHACRLISDVIETVPLYRLECLPEPSAARLVCDEIFHRQ